MNGKQGKMDWSPVAVIVLVFAAVIGSLVGLQQLGWLPNSLSIDNGASGDGGTAADLTNGATYCSGISTVTVTTNDVDRYTPGTDPDAVNFYITTDKKGSQSEGAVSLQPLVTYAGLYAQNSSSVFAEPVTLKTGCSAADLAVEVVKSEAPTITFKNDDGVTINSDSNDQAVSGDATYSFDMTIKSAGKECSARHGALLVADFDKTYVTGVSLTGLSEASAPDYLSHAAADNSTTDGFKAFKYDGELCNNDKIEISGDFTTASGTLNEGNGNIVFHWLPLNYDINQDTLEVIGPAAEDEDNNAITQGNTTAQFHTS
jgi:hypothetical protein